ncbi:hypothetical protein [Cytobacillus praedii]|uniref:Uncharacterized protein n=1 Tax=Cytobacillus praedii TaxID=1742358 RepID=A0A4R1AP44_9BACI|nr:hypothetical protein [Cytobacillus praedii]TCJ01507.1 hypothetical protein E0Y62_23820 [Cytobacillus praedii]
MRIEELKRQAEEKEKVDNSIELLRNKLKTKFKEFQLTSNKLTDLIAEKMRLRKEILLGEFNIYFEKNGFNVTKISDTAYEATYKSVMVSIWDQRPNDFDSESEFYLDIDDKLHTILIRASEKSSNRLYWKHNLSYRGKNIHFKNADDIFDSIAEPDEVEDFIKKIEGNTEWYTGTIQDFDKIKFVYAIEGFSLEYMLFVDLFEAI